MICIYHRKDFDGMACGAIVKLRNENVKLVPFDYADDLDSILKDMNIEIGTDETVYVCDVSMKMEYMNELNKKCGGNLFWIDHHKSAILDYQIKGEFKSYSKVGQAGCALLWKHIFTSLTNSDPKLPRVIQLLSDYDVWNNSDKDYWNDEVLPFQVGLKTVCSSVDDMIRILSYSADQMFLFIDDTIKKGTLLIEYQNAMSKKWCDEFAYTKLLFDGLRAVCMNTNEFNSHVFNSVYDESKHDIMFAYCYDPVADNFRCSIYATKDEVDCSVIAKHFGGGGHKGAAGFRVKSFDKIIS